MPSNSYGCFRHETCGSDDCFKIAKFLAKTTLHGHRSGDVDNVQRRFRFAQKRHNWWRITKVWLCHKNQSPIIPMESILIRLRREKKNRNRDCWRYQKAGFRSVSRIEVKILTFLKNVLTYERYLCCTNSNLKASSRPKNEIKSWTFSCDYFL